jgi:hypothetical protein
MRIGTARERLECVRFSAALQEQSTSADVQVVPPRAALDVGRWMLREVRAFSRCALASSHLCVEAFLGPVQPGRFCAAICARHFSTRSLIFFSTP